jgi:hypothetical protein
MVQQVDPEELERMRREYCEEHPEDVSDRCKDIREEEENAQKTLEAGMWTMILSGISSSLCFILVFAFLMMRKKGTI